MQFVPVASRLLSVKRFSSFGLLTALGLTVSSVIASVSHAQVLVDNNQIEALGPTPAPGFGIARIGGAPAPYPAPGFSPYGATYGGYGYPSYGGVPGGVRYYPNRFGGTPYAITGGSAYTPYGVPAPYYGGGYGYSGYGYGAGGYQGYGPTAGLYGGGYPTQPPRSTLVTPYGASGGYALGFGTVPQQGAAEPKITIRPPKTSSNPQPAQVSATAPRPTVSTPPAPEPLTSTTERTETSPDPATPASSTSQTASTPPATATTPAATRPAATTSTSTSATAPTATATTGNDASATATRPSSSVPAVPVRPVTSEPASNPSQQSGGPTATRPTSYSTGPLLADPESQEPATESEGEGTDSATQTASLPPPPTPESQGGARLLFASGTAELSDAAKTDLDRMVEKLKADSKVRVQILAYAEGTSDAADRARRQSLDRALAVRNYLFKAGIAVTRMDVRALGFNAGQNDTAPLDRVDIIPQTATN